MNKKRTKRILVLILVLMALVIFLQNFNGKNKLTGFTIEPLIVGVDLPLPEELYNDDERCEYCIEFKELAYCDAIILSYKKDECYNIYASEYNDITACDKISDANLRDNVCKPRVELFNPTTTLQITSNLAAEYHLESVSNPITDSIDNYSATNYGAISTSGVSGNAFKFDGVNDYVLAPSSAINRNSGSISLWINTATSGKDIYNTHSGAWNQNTLWFSGTTLYLRICGGSTCPDITYPASGILDNRWHHVTATWVANEETALYVDGVKVGNKSATPAFTPGSKLEIGYKSWQPWYLNGMLDEVRIYNKALSAAEVLDLYSSYPVTTTTTTTTSTTTTTTTSTTTTTLPLVTGQQTIELTPNYDGSFKQVWFWKEKVSTNTLLPVGPKINGCYVERSYLDFDTTNIPDNARITNVKLKVFVNYGDNPTRNITITKLNGKASALATSTLWDDIATDAYLYSEAFKFITPGYQYELKEIDLGSLAVTHLQSQLSQNYFSLGLKNGDETCTSGVTHAFFDIYSSEEVDTNKKPTLVVSYE